MHRFVITSLIALIAVPATAQVFSYRGPRVPIPDDDTAGVDVPLAVSGLSGFIEDLDVSIDAGGPPTNVAGDRNAGIDHEWIGDLTVTLVSPAGTQVRLFAGLPAAADDRNMGSAVFDGAAGTSIRSARGGAPFASRFRPEHDLSLFNGEQANGTWKLRVIDRGAGDTGGVSLWSLHFRLATGASPAPPVTEITSPALDSTETNRTAALLVTGSARDYDGSVAGVLYRLTPPGVDPATVPWQAPANNSGDWSTWSFPASLAVGANLVEAYATDATGRAGAIARRVVIRDEPVFNGPYPDFAHSDIAGTLRVALTRPTGPAPPTTWATATGMRYDTLNNAVVLSGDVNGDGLADLVHVAADGGYTLALANPNRTFALQSKVASNLRYDEYDGHGLFLADFTGDQRADLVQISPSPAFPDVSIAASTGTAFAAPGPWGHTGMVFRPNEDYWMDAGDVDGDGMADLVFLHPEGDLWVARGTATGLAASVRWRRTQFFRYSRGTVVNPSLASAVFLADPNGDGRADVGYLSPTGALWFATSGGTSFGPPRKWADSSLVYKPLLGFGSHIYAADINGDAMGDVLQVGQQGELLIAVSTGNRLIDPAGVPAAALGFRSSLLGPDRVYLANFGD